MQTPEKDILNHQGVIFAPSQHGRLEFAQAVRRLFLALKPEAVAVELPATVREAVLRGVRRLPFLSVVTYQEKNGATIYLPIEPQDPSTAALDLALRRDIPVYFIDRHTEGYPRMRDMLPDPYLAGRLGLTAYAEAYRRQFEDTPSTDADRLREMTMAFHLQNLTRKHARVLFVCGLVHYPAVRRLMDENLALPIGPTRAEGVLLANLAEDSSREILSEMPFVAAAFVRTGQDESGDMPDRLALHRDLLEQARARHLKNAKEEIGPGQMAVLNKFSRNYALVQGQLTPDLYQLLIAARGAVDDNFAYEVWNLATTWPWQDRENSLPTIHLRGEDLFLDSRKIRFHRRFRQFRRRLVQVPVKKRKREKTPGEWKKSWDGTQICSYPPEDIVIEGYGDYLKKKTTQVLSEQNVRTQPFISSMMDGLDLRETIRNWHEGRIYVTENQPERGRVGSVVVIFDEDLPQRGGEERYPWCLTWLGEHDQESDMAFYATPAGEQVIGPGISRCEYGGLMLTYPPLRVFDIWRDDFFNGARSKPERLLMAAIDYSEEKLVAYIAARPPASRMKSLAEMYGKKVVYLPLGQFSPLMMKKIRVFHVLDGRPVREYANEYIY